MFGKFIRLCKIGLTLWALMVWYLLVRYRLFKPREAPEVKFARTLERLGTTFIKLGQALSLRHDLLPPNYIAALQKLQDEVAPLPFPLIKSEIEKSFGRPLPEIFSSLNPEPIGSASIAQVHGAKLLDDRAVIVKVRRPNIKKQVRQDMFLLKRALKILTWLFPRTKKHRPLSIVKELEVNLVKELDFRLEARNVRRFGMVFKDSSTVYIPPVIDALCTERILTQILSHGIRLDDPGIGERGPKLASVITEAFIQQFFISGLFHGDPHPGNLFLLPDGRICFHDFGLVGFLDQNTRKNLAAFLQAFVNQDSQWLQDTCSDLGILVAPEFHGEFSRGLEELVIEYAHLPFKDFSLVEVFQRISRLGKTARIQIPRNLLIFIRCLSLLEPLLRSLDREYNMEEALSKHAEDLQRKTTEESLSETKSARLKFETAMALQDLPLVLGSFMRWSRSQMEGPGFQKAWTERNEILARAGRGLILSILLLSVILASSFLLYKEMGPKLWGLSALGLLGYISGLGLIIGIFKKDKKN